MYPLTGLPTRAGSARIALAKMSWTLGSWNRPAPTLADARRAQGFEKEMGDASGQEGGVSRGEERG